MKNTNKMHKESNNNNNNNAPYKNKAKKKNCTFVVYSDSNKIWAKEIHALQSHRNGMCSLLLFAEKYFHYFWYFMIT